MDEELTVRQGEHVEVRLPATNRWSLRVRDDAGILQAVAPQGELDAAQQVLEWRFLALAPGTATLLFAGRAIPQPGKMSPHFVIARTFAVTVTA